MKTLPYTCEQIRQIAQEFPTPFHIYDETLIREHARAVRAAFAWNAGFKEYYAVKACPNPVILDILRQEGCGTDCASYTELLMSRAVGCVGNDLMFSSNATPAAEFELARRLEAIINLDAFNMIDFLAQHGGIPKTICLRYNPGGTFCVGNAIMGTPGDSKFGMTRQQIFEGVRKLMGMGAQHFGLHAFLTSNNTDPTYFAALAGELFTMAKELHEQLGADMTFVNLSGGLGVAYKPGDVESDPKAVGEGVRRKYEEIIEPAGMKLAIKTEFGRYMTGPAGSLVTTVLHVKETYKHYIGVDASACDLMRPAIYGAYHHITVLGKEHQPADHLYDIVGPLCENNDKFAIDRELPQIDVGDLLAIHDTGAHGYSMGYNYNGKLRSKELLLKPNGTVRLIRHAETPENYFATLQGFGFDLRAE